MNDWPELLLIDKPKGITSFDVIRRLRRRYSDTHGGARAPKLGHAGTLDPLATGLMLVGVGSGTKKLSELIKLDKEYVADVLLGESRTTGDMEGEVVEERTVEATDMTERFAADISASLHALHGTQTLPVSAYSAIKVDGVPMYKRARKAEVTGDAVIDVPMRDMTVYEAELLDLQHSPSRARALATVRFTVASGTYVRSLAEALGGRLGLPACLADLRRTQVGTYSIEDAQQIEKL